MKHTHQIGKIITTKDGKKGKIEYFGVVPREVNAKRPLMYGLKFSQPIGNTDGHGLFYCKKNYVQFVLPVDIGNETMTSLRKNVEAGK